MISKSFFQPGCWPVARHLHRRQAPTRPLMARTAGVRLSLSGSPVRFSLATPDIAHGLYGRASKNCNGRTVALLHGKNFCAATWQGTIDVLAAAGYRVIAPDQIGFCKSSKPECYQYTFQQLARNTHALLASLGVKTATLIAHSTGGMIAVRYALMYPAETAQLVLVDPLGLEDWKKPRAFPPFRSMIGTRAS